MDIRYEKLLKYYNLVCLLLFHLARNRESEANLDPHYFNCCNTVAVRGNCQSDIYLVISLLARAIACECRRSDKGPLGSERPFLCFK